MRIVAFVEVTRGSRIIKLLFIGSLIISGSNIFFFDNLLTKSKTLSRTNVKPMIFEIKSEILDTIGKSFANGGDEAHGSIKDESKDGNWKTILVYYPIKSYLRRYIHNTPEELRGIGCPSWRCNFTYDHSEVTTADIVLFPSSSIRPSSVEIFRLPHQRWVSLMGENPMSGPGIFNSWKFARRNLSHLVNWTMTYHSNSDVVSYYGHFIAKDAPIMPLRPNLMSSHPETMKKYLEARAKNTTLEQIMGPLWSFYTNRDSLVAWMSSHCGTPSKREDYVKQLSHYVTVHKYGKCGDNICRPVYPEQECWRTTLGKNHLFYLSFENGLCDQYISEKPYMALIYNMVPIVYGGTPDYDLVLPPGSYINARHYMPQELAALLLRLKENPVEYGRYHLWRGFWEARYGTSMCELCHKSHTDHTPKIYTNIPKWRNDNGRCIFVNSFNDTKLWKMG